MENWKERLADMLVGYRHNFTLREQLENFIFQELDKAREEGEIEVLTEIFQTCYQEDSRTLELVEEKLAGLRDI